MRNKILTHRRKDRLRWLISGHPNFATGTPASAVGRFGRREVGVGRHPWAPFPIIRLIAPYPPGGIIAVRTPIQIDLRHVGLRGRRPGLPGTTFWRQLRLGC